MPIFSHNDFPPGPSADAPVTSPFIARVIGVDPIRLAMHSPEAQMLAKASAYLLMVSLSIGFLAMTIFTLESLPAEWSMLIKLTCATLVGLAWVLIIGTVDRALLVIADAIGPGRPMRKSLMMAVRFGMALVFSSLFAEQLILAYYKAPIATAGQRLAFEERTRDSESLRTLYKIQAKIDQVKTQTAQLNDLRDRRLIIPPDIRDHVAKVEKCDTATSRLSTRLANLQAQGAEIERIKAMRQDLYRQRQACERERADVEKKKSTYFAALDDQTQKAAEATRLANEDLRTASAKMEMEAEEQGRSSMQRHASSSQRELAFEAAKAASPEISRNSKILWLALILLEMSPFILKSLPTNHPVAAGTQAIHEEEAAEQRLRIVQSRAQEKMWKAAWARDNVLATGTNEAARHAGVLAPLFCYENVLAAQSSAEQKARAAARRNPGMATTILATYADAVRQTYQGLAANPAQP